MLIMFVAIVLDYLNIANSDLIVQPTTPNKMSLTNQPQSTSVCVQTYTELDLVRQVGCKTGNIGQLYYLGIIPNNHTIDQELLLSSCAPVYDNQTGQLLVDPQIESCNQSIDSQKLRADFESCIGQQYCDLNLSQYLLKASGQQNCLLNPARVFMNFSCLQTETQNQQTQKLIWIQTALVIAIAVLYYASLGVHWYESGNKRKQYYQKQVAVADFSLYSRIPDEFWERSKKIYRNNYQDKYRSVTQYLISEITLAFESELQKQQNCFNDCDNKIASVQLELDTAQIVQQLLLRAQVSHQQLDEINLRRIDMKLQMMRNLLRSQKPVAVHVTFETKAGFRQALNYSKQKKNRNSFKSRNFNLDELSFKQCPNPANLIWENRNISKAYQIKTTILVVISVFLYLCFCFIVNFFVKRTFNRIFIQYSFVPQCPYIDQMYQSNQQLYEQYALYDKQFMDQAQSTGVYQCFCRQQNFSDGIFVYIYKGILLFFGNKLCKEYAYHMQGGGLATLTGGMVIGLLNVTGCAIVLKLVPKIGFHCQVKQTQTTVILLVVIIYTNIALITLADQTKLNFKWFQNYGTAIYTGLIMSNLFFYLKPLVQVCLVKKCKKKLQRPEFVIVRRYALIINTVFIVFTFGFFMPTLFIVGAFNFCFTYICDRLLITYWCDTLPVHSDQLHFFSLNVLKYAPIFLVVFAAASIQYNVCLINGEKVVPRFNMNQQLECKGFWLMPIVMYSLGVFFFIVVALIDLYRLCCLDKNKRFESIYGSNTNFFTRLSNIERKSWLAAETYNRRVLRCSTISDYTYDKLRSTATPGRNLFCLDPPNYSILFNIMYQRRLSFKFAYRANKPEELETSHLIAQSVQYTQPYPVENKTIAEKSKKKHKDGKLQLIK